MMTVSESGQERLNVATAIESEVNDVPVIRVEPARGWLSLGLHEVWEYRDLLYFLTWRDVKIRYK